MKKYKNKSNLQEIPGVGPSIEKDLQDIRISCINDLIGKKPENLYNTLCKFKKTNIDKCKLYVFRCAVYSAPVVRFGLCHILPSLLLRQNVIHSRNII